MPQPRSPKLVPALRRHWTKSVSIAAAAALLTLVGLKYAAPHAFVSQARLTVRVEGEPAAKLSAVELQRIATDVGSAQRLARVADAPAAARLTAAAIASSGEIVLCGTAPSPELAQELVAARIADCVAYPPPPIVTLAPPPSQADDKRDQLVEAWKTAADRLRATQGSSPKPIRSDESKRIEDKLAAVESQLAAELSRHEEQERRLASKLTPAHPQLVAIREMVRELSRQAHGSGAAGDDSVQAESEFQVPGIVGQLCRQRDELRHQLAAMQERHEGQNQERVADAARQLELAKAALDAHDRAAERAPAAASVERAVALVVSQPAGPGVPVGRVPSLLVVAAGGCLALAGGIVVPLACYRANPWLTTCREVESLLEVAVAGPIPTTDVRLDVAV